MGDDIKNILEKDLVLSGLSDEHLKYISQLMQKSFISGSIAYHVSIVEKLNIDMNNMNHDFKTLMDDLNAMKDNNETKH